MGINNLDYRRLSERQWLRILVLDWISHGRSFGFWRCLALPFGIWELKLGMPTVFVCFPQLGCHWHWHWTWWRNILCSLNNTPNHNYICVCVYIYALASSFTPNTCRSPSLLTLLPKISNHPFLKQRNSLSSLAMVTTEAKTSLLINVFGGSL